MSQVMLSCFQFSSGALPQRVNVTVLHMALENASRAQGDLCNSVKPILWICFSVDRTFVVISTWHTSQCFPVTETQFEFWHRTIRDIPPESHESLVFLSLESWHDKYTFGLSMWLCETTGPDEDVGQILSSSCEHKCSACWLQVRVTPARSRLTLGKCIVKKGASWSARASLPRRGCPTVSWAISGRVLVPWGAQ